MNQLGSFIVLKGGGEMNDKHAGVGLEDNLESCAGETRTYGRTGWHALLID